MTKTLELGSIIESSEELDNLPIQSVVIVREAEFGGHVAWQLTDDVLNPKDGSADENKPYQAWSSSYYKTDHQSADLLAMAYDGKAIVVYVHPSR